MTGARRTTLVLVVLSTIFGLCFLAYYNLSKASSVLGTDIGDIKDLVPSNIFVEEKSLVKSRRVFFLGDIQLGRDVERRLLLQGADYPYRQFNLWDETDLVVANFESAVPEKHIPTPDNTFRFSTREDFLPALQNFGVTHLSLANNHAFDHGAVGYNHTLTALAEAGFTTFGHPSLVSTSSVTYLNLGEYQLALIAIHTLYQIPNADELRAVVEQASQNSDYQFAFIHWGDEYIKTPRQVTKDYASILIEAGIDTVIGHHPHVVQSIELIDGVPVFYSLGNFIFDQYFSSEVQEGLVLELKTEEAGLSFALHGISSLNSRNQPYLLSGEDRVRFLVGLAEISEETLKESITDGLIKLE